jgi:CPA2 family monovalent cation:H+ antiporter-2
LESYYLKNLIIILFSSSIIVSIFRSFKGSPILGYLLAGILIGPHVFGWVQDVHSVETLGEYGVVFLLFTLGLKMPLQRLQVLRRYVFGLGFFQVLITSIVFGGACYYLLGLSSKASILIGSALSLSSTAVAMQVLHERGEFAQRYGRVSFANLLFQDLAVVVILVVQLSLMNSSSSLVNDIISAGLKAFIVLLSMILLGRTLLRYIYRSIAKLDHAELFVTVTLLVVLITSLSTAYLGLSMELGAFMAGLLLSETEYRHQVEADIQPFYGLLLGFFFMSVGMHIDFNFILQNFLPILSLLIGTMLIKILIILLVCRLFSISLYSSIRTAFLLAAGGEFVFVILKPALSYGFVDEKTGQILYAVTALSMALTPLLASLGRYIVDHKIQVEAEQTMKVSLDEVGDLKNHVVIAGFGRVGQMVAKMLLDRMIPFVAIDNSMKNVEDARLKGFPVFYGDSRRTAVMKMLGCERAKAVVVSLNNSKSSLQTALMLRRCFPHLSVSVRMRDDENEAKLQQAGAHVIMPENLEPSLQLASKALKAVGIPEIEALQIIDNYRHAYQSKRPS